MQRFVEYYFDRFPNFHQPPYHPKWKSINLAAKVPGWNRYWVAEDKLNEPSYRDSVRVEPGDVPVPPGVTTYLVEGRNCVPVTVHRLVERRLPVRLETVGEARISQVKVEPASVLASVGARCGPWHARCRGAAPRQTVQPYESSFDFVA